jgi:cobalt-zinc-cadmium efflux system protein
MSHSHGSEEIDTSRIVKSFWLNTLFFIIELIGGIMTNSMAILSDAAHDFGDSVSLGISWYMQKIAKKESDHKFTYGYRRYSVLGAIVNIIILFIGSVFVLSQAIPRLFSPEEVHAGGMFWIAILGIIVNGAAVLILKKGNSINEKVVSLHLLEDVLGWIAILIGSIAIQLWDLPIIDPILSILISLFILFNLYRNGRAALDVILQRTPRTVNLQEITSALEDHHLVKKSEDLHVWSLDGTYMIMSVVLFVDQNLKASEIETLCVQMKENMNTRGIQHVTFEVRVAKNC